MGRDTNGLPQRSPIFGVLDEGCSPRHGPFLSGYFDPLRFLRCVNGLRRFPAPAVLDAAAEYMRRVPLTDYAVLAALSVLFEPPRSHPSMPTTVYGGLTLPEPRDRARRAPLFPIALVRDVPFLMYGGADFAGQPPSPAPFLGFLRERCRVRARALRPPDRPFAVLAEFVRSPQWLRGREYRTSEGTLHPASAEEEAQGRQYARVQLLRLVRGVYPHPRVTPPIERQRPSRPLFTEFQWRRAENEFAALGARWDANRDAYVR